MKWRELLDLSGVGLSATGRDCRDQNCSLIGWLGSICVITVSTGLLGVGLWILEGLCVSATSLCAPSLPVSHSAPPCSRYIQTGEERSQAETLAAAQIRSPPPHQRKQQQAERVKGVQCLQTHSQLSNCVSVNTVRLLLFLLVVVFFGEEGEI